MKYFFGDYKLKIIEILYTRSGQYSSYKGPHLKNCWSRGPHWLKEQKKKVYSSADILLHHRRYVKNKKKDLRVRSLQMSFFTGIQRVAKQKEKKVFGWFTIRVHISVSAHGPHKMVARAALAIHSNPSSGILFTLLHIKKIGRKLCEYCQIKNDDSKNSASQAQSGLFQSMLNMTSIYSHN